MPVEGERRVSLLLEQEERILLKKKKKTILTLTSLFVTIVSPGYQTGERDKTGL